MRNRELHTAKRFRCSFIWPRHHERGKPQLLDDCNGTKPEAPDCEDGHPLSAESGHSMNREQTAAVDPGDISRMSL